jgi:hypothetical protein
MKRIFGGCRLVLLACALLASAPVAASGFSDLINKDPQIQNALDTIEAVVEAKVTKGESTRGASGPLMQLLFSSDTIICASWIILFRQELQRLIIADAGGADVPPGLIRAAQDLLSRVERACQDIIQGTSTAKPAATPTPATPAPAASDGPGGAPFTPRPGWTITDEICERKCAEQRAAVQRADWRKFDAQQNERAARERLAAAERELAAARERLAAAEAHDKATREELARYEAFAGTLPPGGGSKSPVNMHLSSSRAAARKAAADLGTARNRVPLREKDVADSSAAVRSAEAARARADQEAAEAQAALERCLRDCYRQAAAAAGTQAALAKSPASVPKKGAPCAFSPARAISIGPREKFGYGEAQKTAEVGQAALGMIGGLLGGRRASPGPAPVQSDSRPQLASDPVRSKQAFTDAKTGTAISVGSHYRPDGKLLVSVNVDRANDKGVVHQVALERLEPLSDGSCAPQGMLPAAWLHFEVWEDWWAKIRVQKYESVDGGPWRQTHDSGWRDWGSGSNLLGSGTLPASEIGGTAWGSMGADRAFGGPKAAGALFDAGAPRVVDAPSPERLVIHVTQPGQDPVTTVPFTLYPTYAAGGAIRYSDKEPDLDAALRGIKPAAGAGMPARPAPQ